MNKAEQIYLEQFNEWLIIKGYTSKTAQSLTKTAIYFLNWITEQNIVVEQVSYNDVVAYINYKKKIGNKQRTLQLITNALKHFFEFLITEYNLAENPASNVQIKGIKRKVLCEIFTHDELETIYKSYITETQIVAGRTYPPQTLNNLAKKRNKVILGLLIYQGLKTEELAKLQLQDLQLREGKITLHTSNTTEGRTLKLEVHQLFDLSDYVNIIRKQILEVKTTLLKKSNNLESVNLKSVNLLFVSIGTSLNFPNLMQKLVKTVKETNPKVKDVNHIRTSVITNWLKLYNLRKVQYMAGHRYISSTEAYQVNNIDALQEDVNKYHPL